MSDASNSLLEAVIAGLRERGWPEPKGIEGSKLWRHGSASVLWNYSANADNLNLLYHAADQREAGSIFFQDADIPNLIETIDRLRWVIGLPPRRQLFYIGPDGQFLRVSDNLPVGTPLCPTIAKPTDENVGLVPLPPSKPSPLPSRPYKPRKIGEF